MQSRRQSNVCLSSSSSILMVQAIEMKNRNKDVPDIIIRDEKNQKKHPRMSTYRHFCCLLSIGISAAVFLIFFYTYQHTERPTSVTVETRLGVMEGVMLRRHMGKAVSAFYGVPFAEPPIGDLRFKKPIPHAGWSGTLLKAQEEKAACYQLSMAESKNTAARRLQETPQSEDCLFLNIFVPGRVRNSSLSQSVKSILLNLFAGSDPDVKYPVMIWIHGGAFVMGSITTSDPSQLSAVGEVIVVSIAYRLGIFGFLHSTDVTEAPGNVGLHDQALAIKWVHDNIESFGGDKESVTLFGESAGGISVGYHMMSAYSRPYFRRGIMQSGSPLSMMILGIDSGPLNVEKVAQSLGCPHTSRKVTRSKYASFNDKTYQCLRDADADSLRLIERNLLRRRKTFGFTPTLDSDFFSNGVHPLEFLRSSNKSYSPFHEGHKEILLGTNGNEGASFLSMSLPNLFPKNAMLPTNLSYEMIQEKLAKLAPGREKEIRIIFDSMIHEDHRENPIEIALKFSKLLGDMAFMCPNLFLVDSFLRTGGNRSAYLYHFNVRPSKGRLYPWVKTAMHAEEIQFTMGYPFSQKAKYNHAERKLSIRMMKYWSNFARYGAPNHQAGEERDWPPCLDDDTDSTEIRWHKVFNSDHSEKTVSGLPDNKCEHFEPLFEEMRDRYRYADL